MLFTLHQKTIPLLKFNNKNFHPPPIKLISNKIYLPPKTSTIKSNPPKKMDIESRRQTWEDLPSHLTDPRPPTPSVDSDFDPLAQFSNDELLTMITKSKATSKKLCMREYQISKELEDLTRNIFENESILKRLKKNKEDPQSNAEELKKREIRALLYNIQNYEKKIIKLEKEALDKNSSSKSPFLEELNKEFSEKGYAEKDRNRELG
jgi:hypothetical protein